MKIPILFTKTNAYYNVELIKSCEQCPYLLPYDFCSVARRVINNIHSVPERCPFLINSNLLNEVIERNAFHFETFDFRQGGNKMKDTSETLNQFLHCPYCKCGVLHFSTIEVFNREREDSDKGLYCVIKENSAILKTKMPETNPSSRRNGIRIKVWCENCRKESFFVLFEHKGCVVLNQEILEEKGDA